MYQETGTPGEIDIVVTDTITASRIPGPITDLEAFELVFERVDPVSCDPVQFGFNTTPPVSGVSAAAFPENNFIQFVNRCSVVETSTAAQTTVVGPVVVDHSFIRGNVNERSAHSLDIGDVAEKAGSG